MPLACGTHSGSFHADDVLALALIHEFEDADATVVRTRDSTTLERCDIVFDVGGEFDPGRGRFDHHQNDYRGPLSSAGMVLDWLEHRDKVTGPLAARLRRELVDYVDAVDNGRRTPDGTVPCFTSIVGSFTDDLGDGSSLDDRYVEAVAFARRYVGGIRAGHDADDRAREAVRQAMDDAAEAGRRVLFLDGYLAWKGPYFDLGGVDHPTDFVMFPAEDTWRVVAIPPEPGSFDNKVSLPESWAGLTDDALERVVGVRGARFCHKNRFIAVFATRDAAVEALRRWQLW